MQYGILRGLHASNPHLVAPCAPRILVAVFALLASACGGPPDVYAPPIERKPMDVYGADLMGPFTELGSSGSAMHLVGGLDQTITAGSWRWAFPHAELRFYLPSAQGWDGNMDFAIAKDVLDKTGPQSITIFVNNYEMDKLHYDRDGNYTWRKNIPENMLAAGGMNYLRFEVDKTATDAGGRPLGFILMRAGFLKQPESRGRRSKGESER